MLTLHKGSRTIVTDESFSVKLKWVNPVCFMDSIPGDAGLGLEISANEHNRVDFGHPERFEKFVPANEIGSERKFPDMAIRFGGFMLQRGTVNITDANSEVYSGWLQSELGVLGTAQRDKFINQMAWKKNIAFVNKAAYDPANGDEYALLQIENQKFWDGHGSQFTEQLPYIDENGDPQTNDVQINTLTKEFRDNHDYLVNREVGGFPITGFAETGLGCVLSPFLFLKYVVNEIFRMNGFYVDSTANAMNDEDFLFVVYNNFNIFKQVFTVNSNTYWEWNNPGPGGRYVTIRESVSSWVIDGFDYYNLIPKVALKDFILGIQNNLNLVFRVNNDKSVKIINRNDIPDAEAYDLDQYFIGFWKIGEQKNVTLKFTQEYDNDDDLFANEWHDLSERLTDFGEMVETLAQLEAITNPKLGELRLVRGEGKIYEYKWHVYPIVDINYGEVQKDVLEWVVASPIPQPFFYGTSDEIEEIKTSCSTLSSDSYYQKPKAKQQGNLESDKSLWSNFSFRLLDYAGSYPPALAFDGPNGLFETRWKKWARFWKNRLPVEGEFMLPINELYYVINNITQSFSTRHGKFIIEEMECDFQGERMSTVKIKGYKL